MLLATQRRLSSSGFTSAERKWPETLIICKQNIFVRRTLKGSMLETLKYLIFFRLNHHPSLYTLVESHHYFTGKIQPLRWKVACHSNGFPSE